MEKFLLACDPTIPYVIFPHGSHGLIWWQEETAKTFTPT